MSQVFVETEQVYRKRTFRCGCWGPCTCPKFIHADELMDVLNSVTKDQPDSYYVVLEESCK